MDVIVVDDDKFMKNVFDKLFKDTGLSYEVYHDPHEGHDAIVEKRPACVILDYIMPDLRGDELIVKSSQECLFKYCNFVMVSSEQFNDMDRMKLMTLGFLHIFTKEDLNSDAFLQTVQELVADKKVA
jgi:CheY-like chemotaxis protein